MALTDLAVRVLLVLMSLLSLAAFPIAVAMIFRQRK